MPSDIEMLEFIEWFRNALFSGMIPIDPDGFTIAACERLRVLGLVRKDGEFYKTVPIEEA